MLLKTLAFILLIWIGFAQMALSQISGNIRLPAIFGDYMVLQQGVAVPVWGWANPGETVTVEIAGQRKTTRAGENGKWMLKLDPLTPAGSLEMTISGTNFIKLRHIAVGEVWLCSGQSNMEWPMSLIENAGEELFQSAFANLRLYKVRKEAAEEPRSSCIGFWSTCDAITVSGFSAVAYFFGRELDRALDVPIGLIDASWGGSSLEAWMSPEGLSTDPDFQPILQRYEQALKKFQGFENLVEVWRKFEEEDVKTWYKAVEKAREAEEKPPELLPPDAPGRNQLPSALYNGMISPLVPYAVRGVIWYQGESNVERAYQYRKLFPAMIRNWRKDWRQGDFPFYFVQIAPFDDSFYEEQNAAELRESQLMTLSLPNTGMVVTTDIGNPRDIHPRNKKDVGKRLARWALANTYGRDIVFSGPIFRSMEIENHQIRLFFDHVGGGLVARDSSLTNFVIAGENRQFFEATARIENNTVIVSSEKVRHPAAVRFAWKNAPQPNLFNKEGLPASPFRTDSWPLKTEGKN